MSKVQIAKIKAAALSYEGRYHNDYSGRGMFGQQCVSIYCDSYEVQDIVAEVGIKGARTDSMGKGAVIYWPNIQEEEVQEVLKS